MIRKAISTLITFVLCLTVVQAQETQPKTRYRAIPSNKELMVHDQDEQCIYVLGSGKELGLINLRTGTRTRKALTEVPFEGGPEKGEDLEIISVEQGRMWFLFNGRTAQIYFLEKGNKSMVALNLVAGTVSEKALDETVDPASAGKLKEADKAAFEASAIGCLRTITTAQALICETDRDKNGKMDYVNLKQLGEADYVDKALASGEKNGYTFQCAPGTKSPEFTFWALATPKNPGGRYFYVNQSGVILESAKPIEVDLETGEAKGETKPLGSR